MSTLPQAGWHPDPTGTHQQRYWDGARWTNHVADDGAMGTGAVPAVVAPGTPSAMPAVSEANLLQPNVPKSKTTAVLLAVFLAFWTWLYTYKKDAWKFWVNLGVGIVTLGIFWIASWIWAIIDVCMRSEQWYQQFPNGDILQRHPQLAAQVPSATYVPAASGWAGDPAVPAAPAPPAPPAPAPATPAAATPPPAPAAPASPVPPAPPAPAAPAANAPAAPSPFPTRVSGDAPTEVQPAPPPPPPAD